MFEGVPVDVGLIYEGERIRKANTYAEFGGPNAKGAEMLKVLQKNEVNDGKVSIIGKDINQMEEGKAYSLGIYMKVAGDKLEEDLEGVFERKIHYYLNYVQGFMHLNSRDTIWCRIDKESKGKGLQLKHIGQVLIELFKKEYEAVEKAEAVLYTGDKEVVKFINDATDVYAKRDARLKGLKEEDVDTFYGCILCQGFAPQHMCTITPERISSCGSISWFDGRAAVKIDPKGSIIPIAKGELVDSVNYEYAGVDEATKKKSQGNVTKVYMHSLFGNPHTSCGCFEALAFYIPEVDGIGVVHRNYKGNTPLGLPFSTLAGQIGGGQQSEGFVGIAVEYLRSPKFLIADGGWNRLVWAPKEVLDRIGEDVPKELRGKIATESDACDVNALKAFLKEKGHPVVAKWKEEKTPARAEAAPAGEVQAMQVPEMQMQAMPGMIQGVAGGITITFKNAKIYAEKIIIKKKE